ncbi:MAG: class I SAM-dependent methyltransferase [Pseudomonadota bacterium]|nr:class I SAM-dependent methyltransferase [Pseudomonadota bacterium]
MSELYSSRADLYDTIYAWKDYVLEASQLHVLLLAEGVPDGARVVEAACGTGKHLEQLRRWYAVEGYDLSADMLAIARQRLPDALLTVRDMREPHAAPPADVLLCLFSSIGYLPDRAALDAALRAFAAGLQPGGLVLIEPWLAPEDFTSGKVTMQHTDTPKLKVCRMSTASREGDASVLDFAWLVGRPGAPIEHFTERHELWLCPRPTFAAALDAAGFDARFEPDGLMKQRGLWIGRKR